MSFFVFSARRARTLARVSTPPASRASQRGGAVERNDVGAVTLEFGFALFSYDARLFFTR